MKENKTTFRETGYIAPLCITTDFESEGVLCSSFEKPLEYDDPYNW